MNAEGERSAVLPGIMAGSMIMALAVEVLDEAGRPVEAGFKGEGSCRAGHCLWHLFHSEGDAL